MTIFRAVLIACIVLLAPVTVSAATWQEENRQSARLYNEGEFLNAARAATRAADLYSETDTYSVTDHATLAMQAALMWDAQNNFRSATLNLSRAIETIEERSAGMAPELINLINALGQSRLLQGQTSRARGERLRAIEAARRIYGDHHHMVAQLWLQLANDAKVWDSRTGVERYLNNAREVIDGYYDANHSISISVNIEFAKFRLERGKYAEAEIIYDDLATRLEALDQSASSALLPIYGGLAHLYNVTDRVNLVDGLIQKMALIEPFVGGRPRAAIALAPSMRGAGFENVVDAHVRFGFTIDASGRAQNVRILETSGHSSYERDTLLALRGSRFVPAVENGETVHSNIAAEWIYTFSMANYTPIGSRISRRQ